MDGKHAKAKWQKWTWRAEDHEEINLLGLYEIYFNWEGTTFMKELAWKSK